MAFRRILIVEDDERDLELTTFALQESNLANQLDVARDGEEALEYLFKKCEPEEGHRVNPAVILLDLKLPKLDGIGVLKAIRKDERTRMVPVVVFTSSREEADLLRSYSLGASAYVVKPLDLQKFMSVIRETGIFWALVNEPPPGSAPRRG